MHICFFPSSGYVLFNKQIFHLLPVLLPCFCSVTVRPLFPEVFPVFSIFSGLAWGLKHLTGLRFYQAILRGVRFYVWGLWLLVQPTHSFESGLAEGRLFWPHSLSFPILRSQSSRQILAIGLTEYLSKVGSSSNQSEASSASILDFYIPITNKTKPHQPALLGWAERPAKAGRSQTYFRYLSRLLFLENAHLSVAPLQSERHSVASLQHLWS